MVPAPPSPRRAALARRAALIDRIRAFFARHAVLEVSTPVLGSYATAEPTLANLALARDGAPRFLRTSPESALKRLLAAGSGDVYELGPAFRADEHGRRHREEFTLLEWYRVGYDHHALMDEVAALVAHCGYPRAPRRMTWAAAFEAALAACPHTLPTAALAGLAETLPLTLSASDRDDRALLLDALFAHAVEPELARAGAVLLYDFPRELRAYARLSSDQPARAERFELVIDGLEIANGYHEIVDADAQAACFAAENALRARRGLPAVTPDADWLAALRAGLPPCAGVALGVERLLMALDGHAEIAAARPAELPPGHHDTSSDFEIGEKCLD
ncbi:MAG: EF-P lysine aminoacylase EpmA [Gammaproteobacteria bacterium]